MHFLASSKTFLACHIDRPDNPIRPSLRHHNCGLFIAYEPKKASLPGVDYAQWILWNATRAITWGVNMRSAHGHFHFHNGFTESIPIKCWLTERFSHEILEMNAFSDGVHKARQ
jgi:hypothetical protein